MKLPLQSAAALGFTDAYLLNAAAITALGTTGQVTIASVPPGGVVTRCAVFEKTTSAGTSTDLVLDVGTTGNDPDEYIDALDLDGLTKAAFNTGDVLVNTAAGYAINNTTSAVPVLAEVTFTGTVTAGEWIICLEILDPGQLTNF
jgi:hypothetical protein